MADDLPTVDGYEEYLKSNYVEECFLLAVEEKEVESIMRHQQPKLSCGIDTTNNKKSPWFEWNWLQHRSSSTWLIIKITSYLRLEQNYITFNCYYCTHS